jgi:carbon starvation protein
MCGAISGFHSLVSSGTTPKMVDKEGDIRMIGYGAMLMEGLVGVVALIAAASLPNAMYYDINIDLARRPAFTQQLKAMEADHDGGGDAAAPSELVAMEKDVHESLHGRTGGAVTLAVGMARIFDRAIPRMQWLIKYWYHFAIMFEALFILTTIDTGTRVGRFLVGEFVGRYKREFADHSWLPGSIGTTLAIVIGWGALIWAGSIKTLWPMFGVANQLLASVALCVATTILVNGGKARYAWTTIVPLAFVGSTTLVAGFFSITDIFLVMTRSAGTATQGWIDAVLTATLMIAVVTILIDSSRRWLRAARGPGASVSVESAGA